jgi:cellulose synthase/poly-beta-1,6-N-acetylglucosamine synthase-like glycosyltransferase
MQYAILNLPQFKIYDAVIVLDADNIIEPEFLEQINDAFEAAGTKAIQVHRLSRNRDTSVARLDNIFEEINNAIFRRGHNSLGLSASLNGAGTIYDFEWFKEHIMKVRTPDGIKELEAMLLREGIYIDYFDTIHIYDEKTRGLRNFKEQRARWDADQLHSMISHIRFLPWALLNRHYDYANKILQWILIPRTIMMGIILVMSVFLPFIYFTLAIKWWVIGAILMFAYSLATPDELVDKHWDRDFLYAPILILYGLVNIFHVGLAESETRVRSTRRFLHMLFPKKKRL